MKVGTKKKTISWLDLIPPSKPPEGYLSCRQIAEKVGRHTKTTEEHLKRLMDSGKVECIHLGHRKYYREV